MFKHYDDMSTHAKNKIRKSLEGKTIVTYSSKIKKNINYKIEKGDCSFAFTLLIRDKEYNKELYEYLIYELAEELL